MTLDTNLEIISTVVQAAVIVVVFFRKIYKKLPLFSSYLVWVLLVQGANFFLANYHTASYERQYFAASILDTVFLICVPVELSMSVLSPVRSFLPRWTILLVATTFSMMFYVIWRLAVPPGFDKLTPTSQQFVHIDIASSVLRIVFFLALAGCSQLLSIGWRDRELQIATGLGFYSLISLSVTVLHMNQGASTPEAVRLYHILDEVVAGSYIVSMVYWIVSFAQKEPERREFPPQMQNFLLALSRSAHATRVALSESSKFKAEEKPKSLR